MRPRHKAAENVDLVAHELHLPTGFNEAAA